MIKQFLMSMINLLFLSHKDRVVSKKMKSMEVTNIKLITSSANVLLCDVGQQKKYVRIIRKHGKLKDYVFDTVDLFFDLIGQGFDIEQFREKAHKDLNEHDNYRKILHTEEICQQYVKAVASGTFKQPELFGFPSLASDRFLPYVCPFILFMRGELVTYRNNRGVKRNAPQTFSVNLQFATKAFADLLELAYLVPNVNVINIQYNGKVYMATVMDPSPGVPANSIEMNQRKNLSADFIKCITNLDYFDALCYQKDHKQRNYNVILNDYCSLTGVSAFDNDAPFTFLPICGFPQKVSLMKYYQPVYQKGKIMRRYMDTSFATRLTEIKMSALFHALADYLNYGQILAVWYRMKKLCGCIQKVSKSDTSFFIDFDNEDVIESLIPNINDGYGKDYLLNFLTYNERETYLHIKI